MQLLTVIKCSILSSVWYDKGENSVKLYALKNDGQESQIFKFTSDDNIGTLQEQMIVAMFEFNQKKNKNKVHDEYYIAYRHRNKTYFELLSSSPFCEELKNKLKHK